jgi:hypothetical protein
MRIAIWAAIFSLDDTTFQDRHFAISIDEPLPADLTSDPRLIWITATANETTSVQDTTIRITPIVLIEVFDLPAGSHYIEAAITAPPPYYWYVKLAAGRKVLTDWTKISNEDRLHIEFTTDYVGETGYPKVKISRYGEGYVMDSKEDINDYTPAITDWRGSVTTYCAPEQTAKWAVNPYPREQYKPNALYYCDSPSGTDSEVGLAFYVTWVPTILEYLDYWVVPLAYYQVDPWGHKIRIPYVFPLSINPMLTNNNGQIINTNYLRLYTGHIENDAPTLSEFYNNGRSLAKMSQWTRVTDDQVDIFFDLPTTCLDPNAPLPPDPTMHKVTLQSFICRFEAGRYTPLDLSLGRRIFFYAWITYAPNPPREWAAYPFIRIPESALEYARLWAPLWAIGPASGIDAFECYGTIYISEQMRRQGYFTVEVGRMIPKNTGTKTDLPDYIVDETYRIPLAQQIVTEAALQSLSLSSFTPPPPTINATLQSLSLSKFTPALNAILQRLTLSKMPVMAKLQSLSLSKFTPPPPPPPQYATLTGRLIGILGPVADAEITLNTTYRAKTARDGSFRIDNITPGKYTLTATPTKTLDKIIYGTLKTSIDLSAPTIYTRTFNMPLNKLTLIGAGATTAATAAVLLPRKPPAKIW